MKSPVTLRAEWVGHLLSTAPAERARAEAAVRRLYKAAGFAEPRQCVWFESPRAASWAVALVAAGHHYLWTQKLGSSLGRDDRLALDRARQALGEQLGVGPGEAAAAVGAPRCMHLAFPPSPTHSFATKLITERFSLSDDIGSWFTPYSDSDDLHRAEAHFAGGNKGVLRSALCCPTTDMLVGGSFSADYTFSQMADDQRLVGDREPPPLMRAAWDVAQSAGLWWPCEHAAFLCERPAELHLDERKVLHRTDGPAAVFRDGWRVFAWHGKAVPEKWITNTAEVPPREYRGFDPTFAQWAKSKAKPAATATKRSKRASILEAALPSDHAARLEQLRAHAGGTLPRFDRYRAGAHREVWQELVSLGAKVREDPHAADGLAVAYETMQRVAANVRMLIERLTALGFRFAATPHPHEPPPLDIRKRVAHFEKEVGTLPLSLRAFYEVVGEVNLIGRHPALDPPGNDVAPDPLLVYALDEGAVEYDEDEDDEESRPSAITIAPDDLHKANTSGGAAYEMAIPDLRADGELLHERHHLFFVDYLRLCFRFGGFPGYDGTAKVPAEIETLREGMVEL